MGYAGADYLSLMTIFRGKIGASSSLRRLANGGLPKPNDKNIAAPKRSRRRHDIDLMHVVAITVIVVFHAALPFVPSDPTVPPFAVKNAELVRLLKYPVSAVFPTVMCLFFLLSGWQSSRSVQALGVIPYIGERFRRLVVPLIFGMIVMGPMLKYLELRSGLDIRYSGALPVAPLTRSFAKWVAYYYPHSIAWTWGHLWFLLYLAVISTAASPILWAWKRTGSNPSAAGTTRSQILCAYGPAGLVGMVTLAVGGFWPYYPNFISDGRGLATYACFFLLGAWVAGRDDAEAGFRREWWRLLILGLVAFAIQATLREGLMADALTGLSFWGLVGGSVGLAMRSRGLERYSPRGLREASLPIYVLHYVPLVAAAYFAVPLDLAPGPKFLLILASAAATTAILYFAVVRPFRAGRLLMGMRPHADTTADHHQSGLSAR